MDKKRKLLILAVVVINIALIVTGVLMVKNQQVKYVDKEVIKEVYINDQGEPQENFNKSSAVTFVTDMLLEFQKDESGRTVEERIKLMDDGASVETVVSEKALSYLHLADAFNEDPIGKDIAGLSILTSIRLMEQINDGNIEVLVSNYEDAVYFDSQARLSYIPFDIFIGQVTGFSFETTYIDGEWKYIPYNLIESIKLSDLVSTNYNQ